MSEKNNTSQPFEMAKAKAAIAQVRAEGASAYLEVFMAEMEEMVGDAKVGFYMSDLNEKELRQLIFLMKAGMADFLDNAKLITENREA